MLVMLVLLSGFISFSKAESCSYPEICKKMQAQYEKSQTKPQNKKEFSNLLVLAKQAIEPNCSIPGVKPKIPAYRACYDQGFEAQNGKMVRSFKGPLEEDQVAKWFIYIKDSKFPEGKKFVSTKEFTSTLDGWWAELFSGGSYD